MKANVKRSTLIAAYAIAIGADMIEIGASVIFSEGFASPFNDVMDVIVCAILTILLGWHIAFIPSFAVKLIPMVDLAPTWTLAVLIATRKRHTVAKDASAPPFIDTQAEVVETEKTEDNPPKISSESK